MSTIYDYFVDPVVPGRLYQEITAAGLVGLENVVHNEGETPNNVHIYFASALSPADEATLDSTVAAHDPAPVIEPDPRAPLNRIITSAVDGSLIISSTTGNILEAAN